MVELELGLVVDDVPYLNLLGSGPGQAVTFTSKIVKDTIKQIKIMIYNQNHVMINEL